MNDMGRYPIAKEKRQAKEKENTIFFSGGRRGRAGTGLRMSLEIRKRQLGETGQCHGQREPGPQTRPD